MAWAAIVVPWLRACLRCIRCAHAGTAPAALATGAVASGVPATVPIEDEPPVAPKPPRAPAAKLEPTLSAALEVARFRGEAATAPAARATPPSPAATPP